MHCFIADSWPWWKVKHFALVFEIREVDHGHPGLGMLFFDIIGEFSMKDRRRIKSQLTVNFFVLSRSVQGLRSVIRDNGNLVLGWYWMKRWMEKIQDDVEQIWRWKCWKGTTSQLPFANSLWSSKKQRSIDCHEIYWCGSNMFTDSVCSRMVAVVAKFSKEFS